MLLAALWGASFLFIRVAVPVLGPIWLIEFQVLLAGLVFLPVLVRLGLLYQIRHNLIPLIVTGCIGCAAPFLLFAFASLSLSAGFTSILNGTTPLLGIVIASVFLKEKLTTTRMVGLIVGFIGVVVFVGWKAISATPTFLLAVSSGLCAALMYAIAAPYAQKKFAGVSSLVVASGSQLSAAFLLLPVLPLTIPQQIPSITVVMAVIALALLSNAFARVLYFRLIHNIGSTKTLTVNYLVPIFAMLWGALVLKETVTVSMMLGCSLILLGTAIANDLFTGILVD